MTYVCGSKNASFELLPQEVFTYSTSIIKIFIYIHNSADTGQKLIPIWQCAIFYESLDAI